jgi:hypothetical protein
MDTSTRRAVRERAGDRCEYCHTRQDAEPFFRYHYEHIIPRQHGGTDDASNLALACPNCNLHKGPNLAGIDAVDGSLVALFHPRREQWDDHFEMRGPVVIGRTPTGRVTVFVLNMNAPDRVELRRILLVGGSG